MKQKILIFSLLILVLSSSVFALSWDQWLAKWGEVFIGPSTGVSITGYATATPSCTDSDGGINYYVKGTASYSYGAKYYNYSDYCFSSTGLYERYCSGNYVYGTTYYCPYGCSNGACINVNETQACTDSDGGSNYYVKGTTKGIDGTKTDYCGKEEGVSDNPNQLVEYFCNPVGQNLNNEIYICPYGCKDGACINATATPSCTIKGDINRNGVVDKSDAESILKMAVGLTSIDSCADMNSDGKVDISDVILAMRSSNYQLSCAAKQKIGDVNNDGLINQLDVNLTAMVAVGQIAKPSNLCCIDLNNDGIVDIFDVTKVLRIAVGSDPSPGVCGINVTATPSCTDSDGGLSYYVKGTATSGNRSNTDYCSGNYLYEQYCSAGGLNATRYYCPYGCSNGACILECKPGQKIGDVNGDGVIDISDSILMAQIVNSIETSQTIHNETIQTILKTSNLCCIDLNNDGIVDISDVRKVLRIAVGSDSSPGVCGINVTATPSCTDSDGGLNYYVKGNTTGPYYPSNQSVTLVDHCFNSTSLNEAGCGSSGAGWYLYTCPYGCKDGACINATCVGEGESLGGVLPDNTKTCCSGLTEIGTAIYFPPLNSGDLSSQGKCEYITGNRGYCTKCGDGICKSPENPCNCPADCGPVPPVPITKCTTITQPGTYYLTNNIKYMGSSAINCIDIKANNVVLDCKGYEISEGTTGLNGINIDGYNNITIKNCVVSSWDYNIYARTSNSVIKDNTLKYGSVRNIFVSGTNNIVASNAEEIEISKPTQTSLTCMNIYSKDKHKDYCVSSRCAPDRYLRCERKTEGFWFWRRTYYYEVCAKTYSTGCAANPQCNAGDILINRTAC